MNRGGQEDTVYIPIPGNHRCYLIWKKKQTSKQINKISEDLVKDFSKRRLSRYALNPVICMLVRGTEMRGTRRGEKVRIEKNLDLSSLQHRDIRIHGKLEARTESPFKPLEDALP